MIPRYQRVLLWVLLLASAVMAIFLIRMRERAADKLQADANATSPLTPPSAMPTSDVILMLANDTDGSLVNTDRRIALPTEPHARARYLLNQLLAEYAKPASAHPIALNAGVDDVFLMPLPAGTTGGMLAVVNLSSGLLQAHPSGIETETMTLLSLIGTLHANMPEVTQVRFLVDGAPRDTLAGHADLTRTYLASSAAPPPPTVEAK
jgi:Sporulation and spore germination